jgi:hypothetical protein
LPKFSFNNYSDRQTAAAEARKALLEKFKTRPAEDDPVVIARKAEREAIIQARAEREAAKAKIRAEEEARLAVIRAEKEAQEAAARAAREAARSNLVSRAILEQMDWKAQRLAARKKR